MEKRFPIYVYNENSVLAGKIAATSHTAEHGKDPRDNGDLRCLGVARTTAGWAKWAKSRLAELNLTDDARFRYSRRSAAAVLQLTDSE